MIKQLNPDMTLSEVADILEEHEQDVWSWYLNPYTHGRKKASNKITLREANPGKAFIVHVDRGNNEGIYLTVRAIACGGQTTALFIGKTLEDPDGEHWDKCWLSAGRIAKALDSMWW